MDMLYMYRMLNAEKNSTGLCARCLVGFFKVVYLVFPNKEFRCFEVFPNKEFR